MAVARYVNGAPECRCSDCRQWFPWDADHFHRRGGGLMDRCKPCQVARVASVAARHKAPPAVPELVKAMMPKRRAKA